MNSYVLSSIVLVMIIIVCCLSFIFRRSTSLVSTLLPKMTTSNVERYLVFVQDTASKRLLHHGGCHDSSPFYFETYMEDSTFLLSIQQNGQIVLKAVYSSDTNDGYLSTNPSSDPNCAKLPSLHDNVDDTEKWVVMDSRNPTERLDTWRWEDGAEMGSLDCKIKEAMGNNYLVMDNDKVELRQGLDTVSTIRFLRPNMDYSLPSNAMLVYIKMNGMYLNHTAGIPVLTDKPVSIFYRILLQEVNDIGFHKISMYIQSHPQSKPEYFPSWFMDYDATSGYAMRNDMDTTEPTTWTMEMTRRTIDQDGMTMHGHLQSEGRYVYYNGNALSTSTTRPVSESMSMTVFNYVFL